MTFYFKSIYLIACTIILAIVVIDNRIQKMHYVGNIEFYVYALRMREPSKICRFRNILLENKNSNIKTYHGRNKIL